MSPTPSPGRGAPTEGVALRDAVAGGLRWSLGSQVLGRVVSFASGAVLFRLLVPAAFGFYAFAIGVLAIVLTINDLGLDVSLLRRDGPEDGPAVATTVATVTGVVTYAAVFLSSPWIVRLAGRPQDADVLRVLALVVLVDAVIVVPRAALLRAFRQRALAIGDLAAALTGAAVGVALAVAGTGVWAPVIGTVCGAVLNGALTLWFARLRPTFAWNRVTCGRLFRVGLPIAAAACVELVLLNVDTFIVARLLGAEQLAFYALAFNVAGWPATIVSQAVRRVSIGGFAALAQEPTRLAATARQALGLLVALVVPMSLAIAVLASPLLLSVYGPKSTPAIGVLTWIAVLGGVRVLMSFLFDLLVSTGHQRYVLGVQLTWVATATPALLVGAHLGGIRGAALAHAAVAIGVAAPLAAVGIGRVIGRGLPVRAALPFVVGAGLTGVVGTLGQRVIGGPVLQLVVVGLLMAFTYATVLVAFGAHRRMRRLLFR